MNKHTPGPWRFDPDNQNVYANGMVAQTYGHTHNGEKLANAHLISAAPEMLLWLKNALGTIERGLVDRRWLEGTAGLTIADIREVIAKAEGREP